MCGNRNGEADDDAREMSAVIRRWPGRPLVAHQGTRRCLRKTNQSVSLEKEDFCKAEDISVVRDLWPALDENVLPEVRHLWRGSSLNSIYLRNRTYRAWAETGR